MDYVGLQLCLLGTSNSMVIMTFFFLGVNQSGLRMSLIANRIFTGPLGQLHGPWCEQPLNYLLPLSGGTPYLLLLYLIGHLFDILLSFNGNCKINFGAFYLHIHEWEPVLPYLDLVLPCDTVGILFAF
jgi:hypothetical protein